MKKEKILFSIIVSLLLISTLNLMTKSEEEDYFFNLKIIGLGGGNIPSYVSLIDGYLEKIRIDAEGYILDPVDKFDYLDVVDDWDIAVLSNIKPKNQDMRQYFTENGGNNIFRLNSEIPYNFESETLQFAAANTNDVRIRNQIFWDWQILFMDKILVFLPLFSPQDFEVIWANLEGYQEKWGLYDSLPYLSFDGLHQGQERIDEFNFEDNFWSSANPLMNSWESPVSETITELIFSPLLQWSPYLLPMKTGIIDNWMKIDSDHYKFKIRDNIFWNPSYNISFRNNISEPLYSIPEGGLLRGMNGEYSTGSNQQVTAKDAVFTLLAYSTREFSDDAGDYERFAKYYADSTDNLSFHVTFHDNFNTFERCDISEFWQYLSIPLLPEFFLNSSSLDFQFTSGNQPYIGLYPEIIDTPEWKIYNKSAFGCGKYMLDYKIQNELTVLQKSPYWFQIGAIDGTNQTCNIETINIFRITDMDSNYEEFKNGKLDYCNLIGYLEQIEEMQNDPRFKLLSKPIDLLYYLAFNLDRRYIGRHDNYIWLYNREETQYTKALAVRKAICHSLNMTNINKKTSENRFLRNHMPNPYISDFFDAQFPVQYNGNFTLAKEWMEIAGYYFNTEIEETHSTVIIAAILIFLVFKNVNRKKMRSKI